REVTEAQVKMVGPADVLAVPVGGIYTVNGEVAKRVVAQLKPRLSIIPVRYGTKASSGVPPPDGFLDGQKNLRDLKEGNLLEILPDLKPEKPTVVLMGWSQPKG